jgi:hypothetical protein
MRKIVIIGTAALVVLGGATSASAMVNTYNATFSTSPSKAGKPKSPAPVGINEGVSANGTNGNRTAPIIEFKTKIYGISYDAKDFPTCTASKISSMKSDTGCPKGALVGTGWLNGLVGQTNDPTAPGTACNPIAHLWNGGPGKLVLWEITQAPDHTCAGIVTGSAPPIVTSIGVQGKYLTTDLKIPAYASTKVANVEGIESSLVRFQLNYRKLTRKVHGKTVAFQASVGCKGGKRPYSTTYTAVFNDVPETQTKNGTMACH